MLVFTEEDWTKRTKTLIFRRLGSWALLLFVLFIFCYMGLLVSLGDLAGNLDLCLAFPFIVSLFMVTLVVGTLAVYLSRVSLAPAGVYVNGVGLADGSFLPYLTMTGVERDRRYGRLRSDQVVFHMGERIPQPPSWGDPTPRLPFEFLRMDGLMAIIDILANDPTRGPPLRKEPELIIYGPGGAVR
jgi:hypothetical protein